MSIDDYISSTSLLITSSFLTSPAIPATRCQMDRRFVSEVTDAVTLSVISRTYQLSAAFMSGKNRR